MAGLTSSRSAARPAPRRRSGSGVDRLARAASAARWAITLGEAASWAVSRFLVPTIWGAWWLVIVAFALGQHRDAAPAHPALMAIASLICIGLSGGLHTLLQRKGQGSGEVRGLVVDSLTSATSVAFAAALTIPSRPTAGTIAFWVGIVAFEFVWWAAWREPRHAVLRAPRRDETPSAAAPNEKTVATVAASVLSASSTLTPKAPVCVETSAATSDQTLDEELAEEFDEESAEELDEEGGDLLPADVDQQWTRGRRADGTEWLEGLVRVRWSPRQKHANIHLSFCPPLATSPQVVVQIADGGEVETVVAQSQTFGARLELRRAVASSLEDALILLVRVNPGD